MCEKGIIRLERTEVTIMLDNSFFDIPYIASQSEEAENFTKIYDDVGKLCGFFEHDDDVQMSAYDSLGRFSGYFISNKKGTKYYFSSKTRRK